uniref:No apical meristem-associated C-terminal domain-containing protein n=1 Tax=Tanacetum cinerariifolium TaxID=118510 RepID=A0A699H192_TANCI|nr:hypothetical protein [Tanacetum cinerariifolium]
MYGHYDYGAHNNFGGSSSQPNFDGSTSQPNIGGSSSQPNVRDSSSPVRQFSLDDEDFINVYSSQFSESFCEEQSPVEEARTSEDSVKGNMRKDRGFWIDILKHMHETCPITHRRTYDMVNEKWKTVRPKVCIFCGVYANAIQTYTSGASDSDYLQRALTDYQAEYVVPFTLLHCWEALKDNEKLRSGEIPKFMQERQDGMNKRYKSSGSSSFNTKDSGEGSINLNTTVGTEDENEMEEVQEVRRPKPMSRYQAKKKMKRGLGKFSKFL